MTPSSLFAARSIESTQGSLLLLRLTALLLLIEPMQVWYLRALLILLVGLGLLYPVWLRTPTLWLGITLLEAGRVIRLWPLVEGFHYLIVYWSLAVFVALCLPDPRKSLAECGRWLLAALFVSIIVWKTLLSPDYLDGRYFQVHLLTDHRFQETTEILGGMSALDVRRARERLALPLLESDTANLDAAALSSRNREGIQLPVSYLRLAAILTWGTLLFEITLALVFLLPWWRWETPRHVLLLAYTLGIYALATIPGFGWLVLLMGMAQVPRERSTLRATYVTAWFSLFFLNAIPRSHFLSALALLGLGR